MPSFSHNTAESEEPPEIPPVKPAYTGEPSHRLSAVFGIIIIIVLAGSVIRRRLAARSARTVPLGVMGDGISEKAHPSRSSGVQQQRLFYHFPGPESMTHAESAHGSASPPYRNNSCSSSTRSLTKESGLLGVRDSHHPHPDGRGEIGDAGAHHFITGTSEGNPSDRGAHSFATQLASSYSSDNKNNTNNNGPHRYIMSRPPPPPPLTPPELSSTIFNIDNRPLRQAYHHQGGERMSPSELGVAFFDQPNPDYADPLTMSQNPTNPAASSSSSSESSPTTVRRKSYTKTLPTNVSSSGPSSAQPSTGEMTTSRSGSYAASSSPTAAASSSYPLSSPGPPKSTGSSTIDVHGEIISVTDDHGAGWTRHTRVYGGGVCQACLSSGSQGHGGFYGSNVTPEEKR